MDVTRGEQAEEGEVRTQSWLVPGRLVVPPTYRGELAEPWEVTAGPELRRESAVCTGRRGPERPRQQPHSGESSDKPLSQAERDGHYKQARGMNVATAWQFWEDLT